MEEQGRENTGEADEACLSNATLSVCLRYHNGRRRRFTRFLTVLDPAVGRETLANAIETLEYAGSPTKGRVEPCGAMWHGME